MAEAIELVPYRPLGANERYCPACGTDTLQRAPDGTEYFGGHGEADCYRRRLVFALAELQAARAEAEALRKRIEALERERQTGMWLSTDDCNILMHGLRDRGELEGNLIPEALERYQQLVDRIIDMGVGWSGGAEDA